MKCECGSGYSRYLDIMPYILGPISKDEMALSLCDRNMFLDILVPTSTSISTICRNMGRQGTGMVHGRARDQQHSSNGRNQGLADPGFLGYSRVS